MPPRGQAVRPTHLMTGIFALPFRVALLPARLTIRIVRAALRSVYVLPQLLRRPKVFLLWLLGSHLAQAFVLFSLFMMPGLSPTADKMLDELYRTDPFVGKEQLVLPIPEEEAARLKKTARANLQYGCAALALLSLWLSVPRAARRGERMAYRRERKADELVPVSPDKSVIFYRRALSLSTDPAHTQAIKRKLSFLYNEQEGETERLTQSEASKLMGKRYSMESELGRGAMGVVMLAEDNILQRKVAIKELPQTLTDDAELCERFKREALALARLNHSGIVQVYDFPEFHGSSWIVMEYVDGDDLDRMVRSYGPLNPLEVVRLAKGIAEALEYTHNRGVLHRDLKPANVMVDEHGQAKIMDFGVAQFTQSGDYTRQGVIIGSPSYMSPEQAQGQSVDERTDIYSLGAVLYYLLTGEKLFDGNVTEVIGQVVHTKPTPVRKLAKKTPLKLAKLVMSMVEKDPYKRPETMTDVLTVLNSIRIRA